MIYNLPFIIRRFSKQRLTTFLHIVGLTLGISVCLLIGLFIRHELSFDRYQAKADRIYRVNQIWSDAGKKEFHFSTPFPLAKQIRKDISGLEYVTQVHHPFDPVVEITPLKRFKETHIILTDPEFVDVFDVKNVKGDAREALRKPYQALLTESLAKKYYGNDNPVGKVFKYNNKFNIVVAGVIEDFPGNTHLPASMLLSFSNDEEYVGTSFTHYGSTSGGSTFIVLPKNTKPGNSLSNALTGIYDRTVNKEPWMNKDARNDLELQPLRDVHFNSKYAGGGYWVKAINKKWLWFFGTVGIAVLALACINFVNLSTAQALTRTKEVGVRKTLGAARFQLLFQFLGEAILLVSVSGILAIATTKLILPFINRVIEKQITFDIFQSPWLVASLAGGILFTALTAGIYPSWLTSKFRPADTLKSGSVNSKPQSAVLRKGLVVAQFVISVSLLIAVMLIGRQMNYMRSKNLGFDKDNIIIVKMRFEEPKEKRILFANEVSRISSIKDISLSTSPPSGGENAHWSTLMSVNGSEAPDRQPVTTIMTDQHFCSMYELNLLTGRFPTANDTNSNSELLPEGQRYAKSVVNEKLVKALGFESNEAALGKQFWIGVSIGKAEIIGVVADFNTGSLHEEIKPALITQFATWANNANIKIQAGADISAVVNQVGTSFKKIFPDGVFEFNFLDQQLDALYKTEARLYSLFKIFSTLAILISCLGLWGLISFAAQQRTKEIGIRKVLGATISNIVTLLVKDFVILVGISIAIAIPLTYWGMHKWLQDFAFRINIGWMVFVIAGLIAIIIALITVGMQAFKAAVANPVNSLRSE